MDKKFRVPRVWSNSELEKFGHLFSGKGVNVSGWKDIDKEGKKYRDYFSNISEYWITNYKSEARGFQGDQENEIFLDLEEDLDESMHGKFDVVFNHTVLEHIFDVNKAFENLCKLSNDIVIVVVPFLQEQHAEYGDYWRFTPLAVEKLFQQNSMDMIYINYNDASDDSIYILAIGTKNKTKWDNIKSDSKNKLNDIKTFMLGTKVIKNTFLSRVNGAKVSQQNLNSFLKLGYFMGYKNEDISIDVSNIDKKKYRDADENELIHIGSKLWEESINSHFRINQKHLVPISGGLDSRAILAGLLEHTEAKNIYTYTFGTPNTLDYDVGNYVAKKLGTNHTSFDLTQYIFNQNELEDISKRVDFQTILFHHAPVWEVDKKFADCQNWCGFMGDPLAGSKLTNEPSTSLELAKKQFIKKNTYVRSMDLTNGIDFEGLVECDLIDEFSLTLDEQLDFQNRQTKYIAPHVLMQGYKYKTPFLYQPWVDFMLSVPNSFRKDQSLYKKILLHTFPKEFSYKTKTNFGLPLGASKNAIFVKRVVDKLLRMTKLSSGKGINYLDFNEKIRTKKDLKDVIRTNVMDLKQRNIIEWIDIEEILNNHLENKGNYADALIVLASLEVHLKSGMKI